MRMTWMHTLALLALQTTATPVPAQIDTNFGNDGFVTLGFTAPVNTTPTDHGVAACPGPSGTLVAVGAASDFRRVVTAWLTPAGALDEAFSADGKESFDVVDGIHGAVGLCTSDGGIVLAYRSGVSYYQPDLNALYLVRIDPFTGKPDPAFGSGGTLRVDLDEAGVELGDSTTPTALAQGANHDLLLFGEARLSEGPQSPTTGFILRIEADGTPAATRLTQGIDEGIFDIVAAGVAGNGDIWIGGNRRPPLPSYPGGYLARLDGDDLSFIDMPHASLGDNHRVAGGRMLGGERMGLVGDNLGHRFVALVDPDRIDRVALSPGQNLERPQILQLPGKRLLIAASTKYSWPSGMYFAQLLPLGSGRYTLDTAFGDAGGLLARAPLPSACPDVRGQFFSRVTLWNGAPTAIGAADMACAGQGDYDYLVLRLRADHVFGDGLESG